MMKQFKTIGQKYGVLLFFLIFFLYGMAVARDYGISWDEATERNSSLINLGYIMPQAKELVTDTVNFNGLPPLNEYKDRYYGVAGQFPTVLAEYLYQFRFNYQQIYLLRHLYTFFVFWIACIFFYLICDSFTHSLKFSLMGVFLLISSPRILADSFYNIKDLLFLSLFIITLFFGLRLLRRQTISRLLAFGFFGGLCANCRIVGAVPVICCVLMLGIELLFSEFDKKRHQSVSSAASQQKQSCPISVFRQLLFCLGTGLSSLLFYMAFTPILWRHPIDGLRGVIETFSSYTSYAQSIFYMGDYPMTDQLPWHYLPVWILTTTPVIILLLTAAGVLFQLQSLAAEIRILFLHNHNRHSEEAVGTSCRPQASTRHSERRTEKLFLFLNIAIPLLYVFLFRPVLYNGWRHFYFIYPIMILAALYGIFRLDRWPRLHRERQYGLKITILGMIPVLIWIGQNHPFEYLYFNPIARPFAEQCFEKDYWGVSQLDALRYICGNDDRETIKVWTMTPSENRYFLSYEDQARIEIVEDLNIADYAIYNHTSTRSTEAISQMSLYQSAYVKEIDGMAVYTIFQRAYTPYFSSRLKEQYESAGGGKDGEFHSSAAVEVSGIDWTVDSDGQTNCFTGRLSEPVSTDKIRIETGNRDDFYFRPGDLELSVSGDGVHWMPASLSYREDHRYDYDFHCVFPETQVAFIRLKHHLPFAGGRTALEPGTTVSVNDQTGSKAASFTWNMEVQILAPRSANTDSHRDTVIASADASPQPEQTPFAFDNNLDTRWTSGTAQEAGMFFEMELEQTFSLNQITLVQAGYRSDFPVGIEIFYSMDGVDWHPLRYQSDDMETFRFPLTKTRYVRFRIPEGTAGAETNWSVYEIELWRENDIYIY